MSVGSDRFGSKNPVLVFLRRAGGGLDAIKIPQMPHARRPAEIHVDFRNCLWFNLKIYRNFSKVPPTTKYHFVFYLIPSSTTVLFTTTLL